MKLVIITQPQFFIEEDKIITTLFEEGLETLHLYKPGSEPLYFERLLTLIPEDYHRRIVIHEHYYMQKEFDLGGIHIDDPLAEAPSGYGSKTSRSAGDIGLLPVVKRSARYVLLHNVFDSIHRPEMKASFTPVEIHEASRRGLIDKRVYAMGGMTAESIRWAADEGFGGVVVCGDLWSKFDIHHQLDYNALIAHFRAMQKAAR